MLKLLSVAIAAATATTTVAAPSFDLRSPLWGAVQDRPFADVAALRMSPQGVLAVRVGLTSSAGTELQPLCSEECVKVRQPTPL